MRFSCSLWLSQAFPPILPPNFLAPPKVCPNAPEIPRIRHTESFNHNASNVTTHVKLELQKKPRRPNKAKNCIRASSRNSLYTLKRTPRSPQIYFQRQKGKPKPRVNCKNWLTLFLMAVISSLISIWKPMRNFDVALWTWFSKGQRQLWGDLKSLLRPLKAL